MRLIEFDAGVGGRGGEHQSSGRGSSLAKPQPFVSGRFDVIGAGLELVTQHFQRPANLAAVCERCDRA